MATYDLNQSQLDSALNSLLSPGTANAIITALQQAGDFGGGGFFSSADQTQAPDFHHGGPKILVDLETTTGAFTTPPGTKLFLDLGAYDQEAVTTQGGIVLSGGDGATTLTDLGPGGDTLIGGAGAETLKVVQGNNILEAGSGRNTLVGGSGHDILYGGGQSVLEAGSGATTLIGGLFPASDSGGGGGDGGGHHHHHHGHDHGWSSGGDLTADWGKGHDRGHGHDHDGGGGGGGGKEPADTLVAGSGDDFLQVLHGNNLLFSGSGHDTLTAGDGHDSMYGGSGMDTMNLTAGGSTWVQGGSGADTVNIGLFGNDSIYGGASTTVDTQQASFEVKHVTTEHGVTTVTFSDHQTLTLQHVTINFSDGVSDKV